MYNKLWLAIFVIICGIGTSSLHARFYYEKDGKVYVSDNGVWVSLPEEERAAYYAHKNHQDKLIDRKERGSRARAQRRTSRQHTHKLRKKLEQCNQ